MTMKRAELEKRKGLRIANAMRRAGNPYPRDTGADRRTRRARERTLGLVPLAVKLPADLVRSLQAEAESRGLPLDALVADCLRQSLAR